MAVALPTYVPRWASLAPWVATTYVTVGERVTNDGGKVYTCITAGNTGNAGGPTGVGADIPDPGAAAPVAHWMYIGVNAPAYAGATFVVGARVTNAGNVYSVSVSPGTPSTVAPTGLGPGPLQTADGYVWQYIASAVAVVATPTAGQADVGWLPGQYPPAQVMNKLLFGIYRWILWLQDITNQALTWAALQTYSAGIVVTQSSANADGAVATGNGNGVGLRVTGGATGIGIIGTAGGGDRAGGQFTGHGTGQGINAQGGATDAPGVTGAGGGTNGSGVLGQGFGTGSGVVAQVVGSGPAIKATADGGYAVQAISANGHIGLFAAATGSGAAVHGEAAAGHSGAGVEGAASNAGPGILAVSGAALYPGLQFVGQATVGAPSAIEGGIYYDTTLHKLRVATAGGWETITSA